MALTDGCNETRREGRKPRKLGKAGWREGCKYVRMKEWRKGGKEGRKACIYTHIHVQVYGNTAERIEEEGGGKRGTSERVCSAWRRLGSTTYVIMCKGDRICIISYIKEQRVNYE
jgi:hypothetical protein